MIATKYSDRCLGLGLEIENNSDQATSQSYTHISQRSCGFLAFPVLAIDTFAGDGLGFGAISDARGALGSAAARTLLGSAAARTILGHDARASRGGACVAFEGRCNRIWLGLRALGGRIGALGNVAVAIGKLCPERLLAAVESQHSCRGGGENGNGGEDLHGLDDVLVL